MAVESRAPFDTSRLAIKLIRGVGDARANASLEAARSLIQERVPDAKDIEEINWSWQSFIPRAYSHGKPTFEGGLVIDDAFLRRMGAALRTAAMLELGPIAGAGYLVNRIRQGCLLTLQQVPSLVIVIALTMALGSVRIGECIAVLAMTAVLGALGLCLIPALRSSSAATARATVLLLAWPVIYLVVLIGTRLAARALLLAAVVGLSVWIGSLFGHIHYRENSGNAEIPGYDDTWTILSGLAGSAALLVLVGIGAGLYGIARDRLSPILKILADVVLYLGDPDYRRSLWQHVIESLKRSASSGARGFLLVTHSLGTVIGVDVLRRIRIPAAPVTLITTGSPLRRWFHCYFPRSYPPPTELLYELQGNFDYFKWVNVYRPHDPVGAELGLPAELDVNTQQSERRWDKAHFDYWADPIVHSAASSAVRIDSSVAPMSTETVRTPLTESAQLNLAGGLWVSNAIYGILCCSLIMLTWGWFGAPLRQTATDILELARDGSFVQGQLYVYTDRVRGGDHGSIDVAVPRYAVEYSVPGLGPVLHEGITGSRCDLTKLRALFAEDRGLTIVRHPDGVHDAAVVGINVVYSTHDPKTFEIAQCKREAVPLVHWILAYAIVVLSVPAWMGAVYLANRFLLRQPLAALTGLTESQYKNLETSSVDFEGAMILVLITSTPFILCVLAGMLFL